jgi:hypothetical protein
VERKTQQTGATSAFSAAAQGYAAYQGMPLARAKGIAPRSSEMGRNDKRAVQPQTAGPFTPTLPCGSSQHTPACHPGQSVSALRPLPASSVFRAPSSLFLSSFLSLHSTLFTPHSSLFPFYDHLPIGKLRRIPAGHAFLPFMHAGMANTSPASSRIAEASAASTGRIILSPALTICHVSALVLHSKPDPQKFV